MAWFWTDDLARTLVESGVGRERVQDLILRPAAISAADEAIALDIARRIAGVETQTAGAA